MNQRKAITRIGIGIGSLVLLYLFYRYNPSQNSYFIPCLIHEYTGYQCAGCGSQRAIHQLLHGNIIESLKLNALLVISLPFVLFAISIQLWNTFSEKKYEYPLFKKKLFYIVCILFILAFAIGRNLF